MSGLKLAALYGFPPGRFGLCGMGEDGCRKIFHFLIGERVPKIKRDLKSFEAAFFYYKLIAKENKISDYFDGKIVRAYWIGNELLEKLRISKFKEMVAKKLKKPKLARVLPDFAKPHHSFHVLVVGPMKKDLIMTEGMKDLCKVSWGKILKISESKLPIVNLEVEYQPLLKKKKWFLGKPTRRKIFWDKRILPKLKIGDNVSFHWDLGLEKLSDEDVENLKFFTQTSIDIANFLLK